jgi:hypothetical protein
MILTALSGYSLWYILCVSSLAYLSFHVQMTSPVSGFGRGVAMARVGSSPFLTYLTTPNTLILLQIYAQSGTLVAITTQEGLVRVDPKTVQHEQKESTMSKL